MCNLCGGLTLNDAIADRSKGGSSAFGLDKGTRRAGCTAVSLNRGGRFGAIILGRDNGGIALFRVCNDGGTSDSCGFLCRDSYVRNKRAYFLNSIDCECLQVFIGRTDNDFGLATTRICGVGDSGTGSLEIGTCLITSGVGRDASFSVLSNIASVVIFNATGFSGDKDVVFISSRNGAISRSICTRGVHVLGRTINDEGVGLVYSITVPCGSGGTSVVSVLDRRGINQAVRDVGTLIRGCSFSNCSVSCRFPGSGGR